MEKIMMEDRVYIFGAHSRAQTLAAYLQYLYPGMGIEAYLYDNDEANPEILGGVPVFSLDGKTELHTDYAVWIGTRGEYHQKIARHLEQAGFGKIIPVTVEMDLRLRNGYLKKFFSSAGRAFVKIAGLDPHREGSVAVYVAVSALDKPLQQAYALKPYEREIRAGAALAGRCLPGRVLRDDLGDNISVRNQQFCELTALYWIWKHAEEEIIGLVHYRRHFILPDDWVCRMEGNGVDVILPIPLYAAPDIAGNYKSRHDPRDWDCMMEYLKGRDIGEYREAEAFFRKNLYSPCNMFIMRRYILDELCEWLFPVLFAVADRGGQKSDPYLNRYPGFLSERLITFFFEKYRDRYKVVYSDKNFLV